MFLSLCVDLGFGLCFGFGLIFGLGFGLGLGLDLGLGLVLMSDLETRHSLPLQELRVVVWARRAHLSATALKNVSSRLHVAFPARIIRVFRRLPFLVYGFGRYLLVLVKNPCEWHPHS
jgi:hypothetical protein